MNGFSRTPSAALRGVASAVALVLGVLLLFGGPASALVRGDFEICSDSIDNDSDGFTDETDDEGGCRQIAESSPTSGNGVTPETWTDNPACTDIGYGFGYKINVPMGMIDTPLTMDGDGDLTGGFPGDPANSLMADISDDRTAFDWSATRTMAAVIVKAGDFSNVYIYDPEALSDTALETFTPLTHPGLNRRSAISSGASEPRRRNRAAVTRTSTTARPATRRENPPATTAISAATTARSVATAWSTTTTRSATTATA